MAGSLVLGVDIGSSSSKIGLFDPQGGLVGLRRSANRMTSTESKSGSREYEAEAWWSSFRSLVRELLRAENVDPKRVAAVGLTGQIGTHIVTDAGGNALGPAISWQDGRAWREAEEIAKLFPGRELDEFIGMHLPPGTAWPLPRLLWMKRHEPELLAGGNRWLQPKDYLLYKLTGSFVTDVLSLRGLLHPKRLKVHDRLRTEILAGLPLETLLPEAVRPWEPAGRIGRQAAEETGLAEGTLVVAGSGDFHCSLLGAGMAGGAKGFNITGTSDHIGVFVPADDPACGDGRLGRYPAITDSYDVYYGATSSSGGLVEWFLRTFGLRGEGESTEAVLGRLIGSETTSRGILALPYLNGERAPLWDAKARAVFCGLGAGHTSAHLALAVFEGVAFSLRSCQEIIDEKVPSRRPVIVAGSAAGNAVWNQLKADVLKRPLVEASCPETTCLGAAMLAAVGTGWYGSAAEAVAAMTREGRTYEPRQERFAYYDGMYGLFASLYRDLRPYYEKLSQLRGDQA